MKRILSSALLHVLHALHACLRFSILFTLFTVTACATRPPAPDAPIVVAVSSGPTNLDPGIGLDETSQKIQQLLYSPLLRIDRSLHVVPDLATRVDEPDPLTYVVAIRHGVRFHDGRELTADDVAFTFRRFLDPAFVSGRKGAYAMLASVEVLDRYTVAFHLKAPSSSFPVNLVMGIVPAGTTEGGARPPVGSGPYAFVDMAPDDYVRLRPFAGYYGGAPRNHGLLIRVVPDDTMRSLELRKGTIDLVVNDVSPDVVAEFRKEGRLGIVTTPGVDYAYLGFNLRDPILADARVRQAIGYALDRRSLTTYLWRGLATPAAGILPSVSWAFDPDVFQFTYDPAKARALLGAAGYPAAPGSGVRLHLTLKTSTSERYRLQAAVIQHDLAQVGIDVDVRSYEFATLFADILAGNVQLYTLQWVGVTDPDMLRRVFASSQVPPSGFNRGHYANPEVDRLLAAAAVAPDEAERKHLYDQVQQIVAIEAPYVSLWTRTNVAVFQPDLHGVVLDPIADFTFLARVWRG